MSLLDHMAGGITTTCLAWAVERVDGLVLGFTDHDRDLAFEGVTFRAGSGLTARALQQSTGLSVDNTEAVGAFSDDAIREVDLRVGRFDGAAVRCWLVNWADPAERLLRFAGSIGEVSHGPAGFRAELRGLAEALNRPQGRVIQGACDATLGDARCRFDLAQAGYAGRFEVVSVRDGQVFSLREPGGGTGGFEAGWFERGLLVFEDGAAAGLRGWVKADRIKDGVRVVELWQEPGVVAAAGDHVRIVAGCDKRGETCRSKFDNFLNFRGFPDVPSEDWLTASPQRSAG